MNEESTLAISELGRGLWLGEGTSILVRGGRAGDESDLAPEAAAAFLAATALASLSCNLSLADLEEVAEGFGVGAVEEAAEEGREGCCFACSSSARMLSRRASTPATAWDRREPHLDGFEGADMATVRR